MHPSIPSDFIAIIFIDFATFTLLQTFSIGNVRYFWNKQVLHMLFHSEATLYVVHIGLLSTPYVFPTNLEQNDIMIQVFFPFPLKFLFASYFLPLHVIIVFYISNIHSTNTPKSLCFSLLSLPTFFYLLHKIKVY